ncbi:MurR/RpiR family transcriptional regulator [Tractidigestivibacter sp.]|jgi:RpiR family carbohydrate utilization transcriptional regulator|uniref:MurR/RpiR family transcriptional regulator n=1 Tax=Tractidigestivibacter sp. TaxID=2847320 RepID=UPI003D906D62
MAESMHASQAQRGFTTSERKVLSFIQRNNDLVRGMDVRTLAEHAGTSAATVVRLSKKLGYAGYAEMRYSLSKSSSSNTQQEAPARNRNPFFETRTTLSLCSLSDIETVADWFAEGSDIVLVGGGLTHIAMEYLHHYLFSASRPNICSPNHDSAIDTVKSSDPSTIVVCASVSGSESTVKVAREARRRGMRVVSITSSLESELVDLSDVCFFAVAAHRGADADVASRLGIIAVVDELARTYAHRHPHGNVVKEDLA